MSERLLRVPQVARALELEGEQVYRLIERGDLKAGKGQDGLVYVPARAVEEYRRRQAAAPR